MADVPDKIPDTFQAFLKVETSHSEYVGITVCGPGGTPVYSYIQMREPGMQTIGRQIAVWLAAREQERIEAEATSIIGTGE